MRVGFGGQRTVRRGVLALALAGVVAGCGAPDVPVERAGGAAPLQADATSDTTAAPVDLTPTTTATAPPPPPAPPTTAPPPPPPPTTAPAPVRELVETGWAPFATIEHVVLSHPAALVERVGFHEASHDGARDLVPAPTAARPVVLETRNRGTAPHTAADIVVPPDAEIRAPVTGTVVRAGGYVLYCDHRDDYAVIEPDARPGWEVKLLHIDGVQVQAGQRVEAGVTVIAPRPTILPFPSQVEDHTGTPPWPHVHVEVVDPSIPDRPSPGGGGGC